MSRSRIDVQEELLARVSVRLQAVPQSRLAFVARHNLRQGRLPAYVDPGRSRLNRVLFGPVSGDFAAAAHASAERYRQRVGQKLQRRQARLVEGIITFSHAAQPIVLQHLESAHRCAQRLVEDIVRDHGHGAQRVSLVYHGDEAAPHYHFVFEATGSDGLSVLQRLHRRDGVHLQDLAGDAFGSLGIQRGVPVAERWRRGDDRSRIVHRSVRQLHQDLPREIARVQQQLDADTAQLAALQAKADTTRSRLAKATANLERVQAQAEVDATKVATLQERIRDYTARYAKQMAQIEAIAPKPVEVPVVTGTDKGLLHRRPTIAPPPFYQVAEVDRFARRVNRALLQESDRRRRVEAERDRARQEAQRLRSILAPYPQLSWRLQSRRGGAQQPEQACLVHADRDFVYAVEPRTGALLEGPRPRNLRLDYGMVLEFDGDRVGLPDPATIRAWGTAEVIAAIEASGVQTMPNALAALKARLAQEQAARAEDVPWEAFGSDLDPTQGSGHGPQPTPEDPAQPR